MSKNIQIGDKVIAEVIGIYNECPMVVLKCGHVIFTAIADYLPTSYIKKKEEE